MTFLVGVLVALRRRQHDRDSLRLWVAALIMLLVECGARLVYTARGTSLLFHRLSHTVALEAYVLAGVLFMLSASPTLRRIPHRSVFVWGNAAPLIAFLGLYGADVHARWPYSACIAIALVNGAVLCVVLRRTWLHMAAILVVWMPSVVAVYLGDLRGAVYSSLFLVYLLCAAAFRRSLPKRSRGGLAVVCGFSIWSICFVTHPWLTNAHRDWLPFASEVWDMQKFVITVGLLVVMLEEQMAGMEWASLHDDLTGLANRRLFEQHLRTALERSARYATEVTVFTLDLDGFKPVNDTYGHDAGDIVLRSVAANLAHAARHTGTIARMGGDEFSLIATTPAGNTAQEVERIRATLASAVEQPISLGPAHGNHSVTMTASIGVATCPPGTNDISQLLRDADRSMYGQKSALSTRRQRRSAQRAAMTQQTA